jgi:hypothetical protein
VFKNPAGAVEIYLKIDKMVFGRRFELNFLHRREGSVTFIHNRSLGEGVERLFFRADVKSGFLSPLTLIKPILGFWLKT